MTSRILTLKSFLAHILLYVCQMILKRCCFSYGFFFLTCVYVSPSLSVHVCERVRGWLPSLCLAFVAWARAVRLPRGHHCPRSLQPSGHRCSPIDTMLLTHTPHLCRCVGGQARRPVACHAIGHSQPARDVGRGGGASRLQF